HWESLDAALAHFASKPVFARWAPGVLRDYLEAGLVEDGQGLRLAFDRDIESQIYDHLPHHIGRLLEERRPACPIAFVGGSSSDEVRRVGMAATKHWTEGRIAWITGGHLFPMERPRECADTVLELLERMPLR
ncbi:MAG TPA: alpha/beta hydrolase, partial [Methylibium sp.]|nr:alpha/beta hydrolase [Methylibium sp.]